MAFPDPRGRIEMDVRFFERSGAANTAAADPWRPRSSGSPRRQAGSDPAHAIVSERRMRPALRATPTKATTQAKSQ